MSRIWVVALLATFLHNPGVRGQESLGDLAPFLDGASGERWSIYAGGSFYFLTPRWSDASSFQTFTVVNTGPADRVSVSQSFLDHGNQFAPKLWLGFAADSGLGVRASGWWLGSSAGAGTVVPVTAIDGGTTTFTRVIAPGLNRGNDDILTGGPFDQGVLVIDSTLDAPSTLTVNSRLEMRVIDLEAHQPFSSGLGTLLVAAGVRFARIDQTYDAHAFTPLFSGVGSLTQDLRLGNRFEGVGPELALELHRRLGESGFALYANGRAGVLFGTISQTSTQAFLFVDSTGVPIFDDVDTRNRSDQATMPFVEFEAGLEWGATLGRISPFLRGGVVGQNWFGAGSPSSNPFNKTGDLGLFGFQVTTGLGY